MLRLPTENTLDREENIMAEWITTTLEECTDILGDGLHGTPKYTENGEYAFVNGNNLVDGEILIKKETKRVDYSQYDKYKKPLTNRTILVSINGTLGNVGVYGSEKIILGKSACYFNVKESVDKDFIYYIVSSPTFKQYLESNATGTTIKNISLKQMREYTFELPEIGEQKRISSVLRKIDEKIKNNRAINNNLEQQAQAIFKSWFVDFEPFNGEMPHNWIVSRLGDIASIKTNSFSPVKNPDAQLEHYSIPAYDEQNYPVFESAADVKSNKYILSKNSVMISKLNPDIKRVWRPMCLSELAVSSTEFIIFEAFNPAYRDFVFSIIDSAAFSDWMCAHTTGSTNSRQRTAPSATLEFQVALPDEKAIIDFCAIVTPMYDTIASNICENQKLAQLRDSILPKLMSGELDVSNIDL